MANRIIDYTPSPVVEAFIREYLPEKLFYNFIVGPLGSGKTTGILFKIVYMAKLQAPSPVDGIRRSKVVIVRNTASQLADTTIPSWFYWFRDGEAGVWKATPKTFVLRFDDVECEVLFRPLDTPDDVSRVLSLEVTFAVLDEFVEIPKEVVEALSGRCGRYPPAMHGGATNYGMWGASNPGEEGSWWHEMLVENRPENWFYFHQPSGLSDKAENLENLKPGYYENLRKGKSEAWIHRFIEANWGYTVSGKPVVPSFSRDLHVSKTKLTPDPNLPLIIGFDPGMNSALIFGQQDFYGRVHVLEELILEGYGAERMISDKLKPILRTRYPDFEVIIVPDPAANSRTPTNETTVLDVLRSPKYRDLWSVKVLGSNLLQPRIDAIEYYTTRLTEKGPALVIDPRAKTLIQALSGRWQYGTTRKGDTEKPMPDKNRFSHPGDGLGYLCQYARGEELRTTRKKAAGGWKPPRFVNPYALR